jgi:hypothetical protein
MIDDIRAKIHMDFFDARLLVGFVNRCLLDAHGRDKTMSGRMRESNPFEL